MGAPKRPAHTPAHRRPPRPGGKRRVVRPVLIVIGALALVAAGVGIAFADPPPRLPANADQMERTFQPAHDYDTDSCYPAPAIGPDGTLNGGLDNAGSVTGQCRDLSDLGIANEYSRYKCDNGWCGIAYALYFEKDQAVANVDCCGHRHDWEHVVIWVEQASNEVRFVAASAHGGFNVRSSAGVAFDGGTHPKIVYHKDGASTHAFRFAGGGDEPPENHTGQWHYPALVGFEGFPSIQLRDTLSAADWGSANFGLRHENISALLREAMPDGIPFNPDA